MCVCGVYAVCVCVCVVYTRCVCMHVTHSNINYIHDCMFVRIDRLAGGKEKETTCTIHSCIASFANSYANSYGDRLRYLLIAFIYFNSPTI